VVKLIEVLFVLAMKSLAPETIAVVRHYEFLQRRFRILISLDFSDPLPIGFNYSLASKHGNDDPT
jgi:hypothetical protein